MPAIEKIKGITEYEFQQSKYYPECPRVPMRTCLVSGSGGGKTTTILAMCLQIYGFEVFQRIIVVSPSIGIDDAWNPLFSEMRKRLDLLPLVFESSVMKLSIAVNFKSN